MASGSIDLDELLLVAEAEIVAAAGLLPRQEAGELMADAFELPQPPFDAVELRPEPTLDRPGRLAAALTFGREQKLLKLPQGQPEPLQAPNEAELAQTALVEDPVAARHPARRPDQTAVGVVADRPRRHTGMTGELGEEHAPIVDLPPRWQSSRAV